MSGALVTILLHMFIVIKGRRLQLTFKHRILLAFNQIF